MYEADPPIDSNNIPLFRRDEKGVDLTPVYVFGYAPTSKELLEYAKKHNLDRGGDESQRTTSARSVILCSLPDVLANRTAAVPIRPVDDWGTYAPCQVIATNLREKEMSLAENRDVIELLKEAYETEEEPKWYKLPRGDLLSLRG